IWIHTPRSMWMGRESKSLSRLIGHCQDKLMCTLKTHRTLILTWHYECQDGQLYYPPNSFVLKQNYSHGDAVEKDGFLHYPRRKYTTETVSLRIPFPVTFIRPNPLVNQNQGRIAIRRGPFIFAMDSADNDFPL